MAYAYAQQPMMQMMPQYGQPAMQQMPMYPQQAYGGMPMTPYQQPYATPYNAYGAYPPGLEYKWCLECKDEKDRLDDRRDSGGRSQRALLARDAPDTEVAYDWSAYHAQVCFNRRSSIYQG